MIPKNRFIAIAAISIFVFSILFIGIQLNSQKEDIPANTEEDSQLSTSSTDNEHYNPRSVEKIFIKGSDTILPVSQAETDAYMKMNPEHEVIVIGGGSSLGIASFIEGEVEIAMASRKIRESEIEAASVKDIEPIETVIAWDGISVIVNKGNPVESLSLKQLRQIYTGEITNWKELGGNDENIKVLVRETSSGTYGFFKENVLLDQEYSQSAITEPNTEAVVDDVATDTAAIGYIGLAYMDESVKMLGLGTEEGTFYPEADLIRQGTYPLSRPLQYYTDGRPDGVVKEYIDFVLSDTGQEIVANVGYLPVR